ncbi:hypothetical protein PGT21_011551 [Puccinia graminis f. sp. tritici]|uniref:Uncharacterized protein n=1 Tax=Puccinia graminis f. sp. tritici TaxID=56615 RepID=A0A5B0PL31_PUCGR|nr:hypothetical protein PGT21_011551 [Puccinia graminis f. sp. tritici]
MPAIHLEEQLSTELQLSSRLNHSSCFSLNASLILFAPTRSLPPFFISTSLRNPRSLFNSSSLRFPLATSSTSRYILLLQLTLVTSSTWLRTDLYSLLSHLLPQLSPRYLFLSDPPSLHPLLFAPTSPLFYPPHLSSLHSLLATSFTPIFHRFSLSHLRSEPLATAFSNPTKTISASLLGPINHSSTSNSIATLSTLPPLISTSDRSLASIPLHSISTTILNNSSGTTTASNSINPFVLWFRVEGAC